MKCPTLLDKAFLLKRTQPFSMLDIDLLITIADKLSVAVFEEGDFIFLENEEANRMYFIMKGQIEIRTPESQPICLLSATDFFGEESLFSNKPRAYQAYSPVESTLLTLSRSNLHTIISESPSVAMGFLQVYTSALAFRPFIKSESEA